MVEESGFTELMGGVCAPVTVVTTMTADGRPHGSTVSSFAALSLRPPMVSFALDVHSELLRHIHHRGWVGVNVLAHDQQKLATAFAGHGADKFAGLGWRLDSGLPRLDGAGGWLLASISRTVPGGDHCLMLAAVHAAESSDAAPLVYARRTFGTHSVLAEPAR